MIRRALLSYPNFEQSPEMKGPLMRTPYLRENITHTFLYSILMNLCLKFNYRAGHSVPLPLQKTFRPQGRALYFLAEDSTLALIAVDCDARIIVITKLM